MNAVTPIRALHPRPVIPFATPRELFDRLHQCAREIASHEGVVDADQTNSPRVHESHRLLDILRREDADLRAALAARFLIWSGGITLDAFAGELL